jgi:hypothetical protein
VCAFPEREACVEFEWKYLCYLGKLSELLREACSEIMSVRSSCDC